MVGGIEERGEKDEGEQGKEELKSYFSPFTIEKNRV